jgi:hypothetical protein
MKEVRMNDNFRVVTTKQLRKIGQHGEKMGFTRLPNDQFWNEIDPQGKHVLNCFHLPGEYRFVRTFSMCKLKEKSSPAEVWIDVAAKDWNGLGKEAHE